MAMAIIMPVTARRIMADAQPTKTVVFMSENNKKPRVIAGLFVTIVA